MFGGTKTEIRAVSNSEIANIILTILNSKQGHETFKNTTKEISKELVEAIDKFLLRLTTERYFETHQTGKYNEKEVKATITELKTMLKEFPDEYIDQLVSNITTKYSIGMMVIESVVLGVIEFFREKFELYYSLLRLQNGIELERKIKKYLSDFIKIDMILNPSILMQIFPTIKPTELQTFDPSNPESKTQTINTNGSRIEREISSTNLEFMKRIVGYNPADKGSVKRFEDVQKRIRQFETENELEIKDRMDVIDRILIDLTENLIYNLLDLRKKIFRKELQKALSPALSGDD